MRRFADMEVFVEIQENVRGEDVFVIQSTSFPANDHLMELLDLHRRAAPLVGEADHGGHSVFRLCAAGPQARAAHADFGEARSPTSSRRPGRGAC